MHDRLGALLGHRYASDASRDSFMPTQHETLKDSPTLLSTPNGELHSYDAFVVVTLCHPLFSPFTRPCSQIHDPGTVPPRAHFCQTPLRTRTCPSLKLKHPPPNPFKTYPDSKSYTNLRNELCFSHYGPSRSSTPFRRNRGHYLNSLAVESKNVQTPTSIAPATPTVRILSLLDRPNGSKTAPPLESDMVSLFSGFGHEVEGLAVKCSMTDTREGEGVTDTPPGASLGVPS